MAKIIRKRKDLYKMNNENKSNEINILNTKDVIKDNENNEINNILKPKEFIEIFKNPKYFNDLSKEEQERIIAINFSNVNSSPKFYNLIINMIKVIIEFNK